MNRTVPYILVVFWWYNPIETVFTFSCLCQSMDFFFFFRWSLGLHLASRLFVTDDDTQVSLGSEPSQEERDGQSEIVHIWVKDRA